MKVKTNVFLSEGDVRKIVKQHLEKEGYTQLGELEIIVRSKKDITHGATAGDVLGINANVERTKVLGQQEAPLRNIKN